MLRNKLRHENILDDFGFFYCGLNRSLEVRFHFSTPVSESRDQAQFASLPEVKLTFTLSLFTQSIQTTLSVNQALLNYFFILSVWPNVGIYQFSVHRSVLDPWWLRAKHGLMSSFPNGIFCLLNSSVLAGLLDRCPRPWSRELHNDLSTCLWWWWFMLIQLFFKLPGLLVRDIIGKIYKILQFKLFIKWHLAKFRFSPLDF